jgi:hypothetical protein
MDSATRPWLAAGWTVVVVGGATTTAELRHACECASAMLRRDHRGGVVCDLSAMHAPDLEALDALARLRLTAQRLGARVTLRPLSPQLQTLVGWTGLERALLDDRAD